MREPDWSFPYSSQRMPVLAENVVATSQPLAAQAGLEMLEEGGSAVDAALATAIALTVVEPTSNGIGGDAFAIVWDGQSLHGLNGSGRSPAALSPERFAALSEMPTLGWDAVTVPGCVAAWKNLHERFGVLPFEHLFEPAIHYAANGYLVSPITAQHWARAVKTYSAFDEWQRVFAPKQRPPKPGERITLADHAATLETIAMEHGESFYRGELAQRIAQAAANAGAALTLDDLAAHESLWVDPIGGTCRGLTLHEIPPNGQGIAALIMLGIAQHFDLEALDPDGADSIHIQIEAMKLAFADAHRFVADPAKMDVRVSDLLDPAYLESRAKLIDRNRAQNFQHGTPSPGGTVYLTAADADGMMVSFIQSNYMGFGSGIVIPGTGIAMQNRGANFTLEKGHPNEVAGRKRPYHTIIPGFVTQRPSSDADSRQPMADSPLMSFGVMGGFMQPQGHAQVMIRLAEFGQNPQAILDAPRWRVGAGLHVELEPGFDPGVYAALRERGHTVLVTPGKSVAHGRGQAILKLTDGYLGASDPRSDGQAVGF